MILIRIASYSAFHPSNLINRVSFAVHIDQKNMDIITCTDQNFDFCQTTYLILDATSISNISTISWILYLQRNRISSSVKILALFLFREREVRRKIENFIHHTLSQALPLFVHKFSWLLRFSLYRKRSLSYFSLSLRGATKKCSKDFLAK